MTASIARRTPIDVIFLLNLPVSEFDSNCRTSLCSQCMPYSDCMDIEQHFSPKGPTFSDIFFFGIFTFCVFFSFAVPT